jgi:hypothetical protein
MRRKVYQNRGPFTMRNVVAMGMTTALVLMLNVTVPAATITVNSLADVGAPSICVLRDAITAANTMTAIHGCAAGTGNDIIGFSVTGTIMLGSTLPQVSDQVLTINGPASPGITISGGGAVQVIVVTLGATLNLTNLTIADGNTSSGRGGAIDNEGTLAINNNTFSGNSASAIFNHGKLTVTHSNFSGNTGIVAGGIRNERSLIITHSTFSGNRSSRSGGCIFNLGKLTITRSTFSGNTGAFSGGIFSESILTVTDSTFSGNRSGAVGGGIWNTRTGKMTISNSTFSDNIASSNGGGMYSAGMATVTNSTFSSNRASSAGGGIYNRGTLAVSNSTFSGNSAPVGGGGIINLGLSSLKSMIIAHNSVGNCSGMFTDAGFNISDDATCSFSATGSHNNTDPMLNPRGLRHNGGPTKTIALLSGSPAIDAIPVIDCTDQASPPNPIVIDQRHFPRPDAGEDVCDIGAYEFQDTSLVSFSIFGRQGDD